MLTPTMRPILPWLAILDQRILERVMRLAPEVLFEGGDPAQLPVGTRIRILRESCEQLAQPAHGRSITDYSAVQRFTNPDLADVIRELLEKHKDDDDIVWFLLRMVQQGAIAALADKAKHFALVSRSEYTRIAGIRAMIETGSQEDAAEVREAFVAEGSPLRRSWLGELLDGLGQTKGDVDWLLAALALAEPKKRFETDPLSGSLDSYVAAIPPALLADLLEGFGKLLSSKPIVEQRHCEISKRYSWLGQTAGQALLRMIGSRDPAALEITALSILRKLPIAEDYTRTAFEEIRHKLAQLVQAWPELNRALFWNCVAEERTRRERQNGERLADCWRVSPFGAYWAFDGSDFDYTIEQIAVRPLMDDTLIALTLAFRIYRQHGRPRVWRARLKRAAAIDPELENEIRQLLNPPKGADAAFRRQQAAWKRRVDREAAKEP